MFGKLFLELILTEKWTEQEAHCIQDKQLSKHSISDKQSLSYVNFHLRPTVSFGKQQQLRKGQAGISSSLCVQDLLLRWEGFVDAGSN